MKMKFALVAMLTVFLVGCTQTQIDRIDKTKTDADELLENSKLKENEFNSLGEQLKTEVGE